MRSDRLIAMLLVGAGALAGCQRSVVENPASAQFPAAEEQLEFLDALETQRVVTNDDALHGLLMFADADADLRSWDERVARAKEMGWIPENAEPVANESVTVGRVSSVLVRVLGIKGGLTMRLFGPSPRYATRELVYLRLLTDRTEDQTLSGLEFLDLLSRAEEFRAFGGKADLTVESFEAGETKEEAEEALEIERERDRG